MAAVPPASPLSLSLEDGDGFMLAHGHGRGAFADFLEAIDRVADGAAQRGARRVLIDLRGVEQSLSFTEHLQVGARLAQRLAFVERAASVVPQQLRTGSSEKAAQKTGLNFRTFTSMEEARAWLSER